MRLILLAASGLMLAACDRAPGEPTAKAATPATAPASINDIELIPRDGMSRREIEQRAADWLVRVGLADRLEHTPRQLSGGEQQRVALARAFAPGPQVLFADEPTGSLDSATGAHVADLLFELNKESGTTLVLVTHDERLAHRCRRLIRLEAGLMVAPLEP